MVETKELIDCSKNILCKSGAWIWDTKTESIFLSDEWKKMLGFLPDEIPNLIQQWIDRLHPNDKFKTLKILTSLKKDINPHFDFFYRIKNNSGYYCWMNCYGSATEFDVENNALIIKGVQYDVDELKTSEEYFKEGNLRLGKLTENFGGGILLENEERKIFFINKQFCDYFNIPVAPGLLLGGDCSDAADNSKHLFTDPQLFITGVNSILKNKIPIYGEIFEMKNGLILERDYIPIFEEQRYKGHLWIYRDITHLKKHEEALVKSESQYRLVVNSIKEVVFQTDVEGNWVFLNPAWTEIMGYSIEESIGKNFSNFIHIEEQGKNLSVLRPLIAGELEFSLHDVMFLTKDGIEKICEVYVKSVITDNNEVVGISGTIRDISLQRKSEQEIKKLNRAIETTETGILLSDFKGIITYVNPGLKSICGFKSSEHIVGRSIFTLASNEGTKVLKDAIITKLMSGYNWKGEIELRKANGKFFPAEAICSVVHDDKNHPQYVVANFYDISERKKADAEIKKSLIKERELSEMKTRFVSMVSHEFRTPLAAILSSSELIEMYGEKLSDEKRTSLLSKIKTSVKNLIEILTDVTEINRADAGKATVNLEEIDLVILLNDLIDEVKQGNPVCAKINYVQIIDSLVLISDKKLLRQIFINLISNSAKYTNPQKNIYLTLERQPDLTIFMVRDEGIGIPENDFDILFEPFMRSKNTGKIKGTGLGLSILKRAIDLLGGRIDFESKVNVGSTFTVYLPDYIHQTKQETEI